MVVMRRMSEITLFDYWRSSASYRVRIALNLKQLDYSIVGVDLLKGEHKNKVYLNLHPQGLVPAIKIDGEIFTQSLAIIEYLEDLFPDVALLPKDAKGRARVRALSFAVAMEIHPVCNLSVVNDVIDMVDGDNQDRIDWMQKYIRAGLEAFEIYLNHSSTGLFCHGDQPSMADCCLIPQLYNAQRWGAEFSDLKMISAIHQECMDMDAFKKAYPDAVKP